MDAERLPTLELVREITAKGAELVKKEVELAIAETKADLRAELGMVKMLAAAAVGALATLNLLLVAAALALGPVAPPWLAALALAAVAGVVTLLLGAIAWRLRVTRPLARTRKTVEEDVRWAKEQIA